MKRRAFIKKMSMAAALPLIYRGSANSMVTGKLKNWVWVTTDPDRSDDDWKRLFEQLQKAHIHAIIPEVYNGRHAYFASDRLPVKAPWLEQLIPLVKAAGLEIHAWMWCMPCLIDDIQQKHPDWYAVNRLGQPAHTHPAYVNYYKFLCPSHPEVHEFIRETVRELSQYDVDGIHFDYIRYPDVILAKGLWEKYRIVQDKEYPSYDYCYCDHCRKKFRDAGGPDPMKIADPAHHAQWLQFRYDQVTDLVNQRLIPQARQFSKKTSAAVFPNWRNVRQQWPVWQLDDVFPMLYNRFYLEDENWIYAQTHQGIDALKYDTKLYSGLMVDDPPQLEKYIKKSLAGGAKGVSMFSLNGLRDEHYQLLTRVLNPEK